MNPWSPVGTSCESDRLAPHHPLPDSNVDPVQIGDRDLEPFHRLDAHGGHAGDRAGKGDHPRRRRPDCRPVGRGQIEPPMPPVLAYRGVSGDHRPLYRRQQAHR